MENNVETNDQNALWKHSVEVHCVPKLWKHPTEVHCGQTLKQDQNQAPQKVPKTGTKVEPNSRARFCAKRKGTYGRVPFRFAQNLARELGSNLGPILKTRPRPPKFQQSRNHQETSTKKPPRNKHQTPKSASQPKIQEIQAFGWAGRGDIQWVNREPSQPNRRSRTQEKRKHGKKQQLAPPRNIVWGGGGVFKVLCSTLLYFEVLRSTS